MRETRHQQRDWPAEADATRGSPGHRAVGASRPSGHTLTTPTSVGGGSQRPANLPGRRIGWANGRGEGQCLWSRSGSGGANGFAQRCRVAGGGHRGRSARPTQLGPGRSGVDVVARSPVRTCGLFRPPGSTWRSRQSPASPSGRRAQRGGVPRAGTRSAVRHSGPDPSPRPAAVPEHHLPSGGTGLRGRVGGSVRLGSGRPAGRHPDAFCGPPVGAPITTDRGRRRIKAPVGPRYVE